MTLGMFLLRVAAGLLLGALAPVVSPKSVATLETFSAIVGVGSLPVSALVAMINLQIRSQHYVWWKSHRQGSGNARYVIVNALTGAPIVAAMAFVGMFGVIVLFMAP